MNKKFRGWEKLQEAANAVFAPYDDTAAINYRLEVIYND